MPSTIYNWLVTTKLQYGRKVTVTKILSLTVRYNSGLLSNEVVSQVDICLTPYINPSNAEATLI